MLDKKKINRLHPSSATVIHLPKHKTRWVIYFLNSSISAIKQTAKVSKMIVPAHTATSIVAIFAPSLIWKDVFKTGSGRLQVEGRALGRSKGFHSS